MHLFRILRPRLRHNVTARILRRLSMIKAREVRFQACHFFSNLWLLSIHLGSAMRRFRAFAVAARMVFLRRRTGQDAARRLLVVNLFFFHDPRNPTCRHVTAASTERRTKTGRRSRVRGLTPLVICYVQSAASWRMKSLWICWVGCRVMFSYSSFLLNICLAALVINYVFFSDVDANCRASYEVSRYDVMSTFCSSSKC